MNLLLVLFFMVVSIQSSLFCFPWSSRSKLEKMDSVVPLERQALGEQHNLQDQSERSFSGRKNNSRLNAYRVDSSDENPIWSARQRSTDDEEFREHMQRDEPLPSIPGVKIPKKLKKQVKKIREQDAASQRKSNSRENKPSSIQGLMRRNRRVYPANKEGSKDFFDVSGAPDSPIRQESSVAPRKTRVKSSLFSRINQSTHAQKKSTSKSASRSDDFLNLNQEIE